MAKTLTGIQRRLALACVTLSCLLGTPAWSNVDQIITLEGDLLEGKLERISPNQELQLADQAPWPLDELRAVVPANQIAEIRPAPYTVWLTNGSRFSTHVLTLAEETYQIDNPVLGPLELPIDLVWAIRMGRPDPDSRFARAVRLMNELEEDVIYASGTGTSELQEVNGLIEELDAQGLSFDQEGELKILPLNQVHGVLLASPAFEPETDDWITSRLALSDGSLISGNIQELDGSQISLALGEGLHIELPWKQVRRLTVESDLLHYLSDLEPSEESMEAIYAFPRTWKRDLNIKGKPLRLGPDRFEKGLGVSSGTSLTFVNDADYRLFTATIGLERSLGPTGDCEFVIRSGKNELLRQRLGSDTEPQFIKLDITNLEEITLSVEPGVLGLDLGDDANWAEACFLQAKEDE